jgi:glucose/arabinose dehydrogenase
MSLRATSNPSVAERFVLALAALLRNFKYGFAVLLAVPCVASAAPPITLQEVASGFSSPVELVNSGDGSGRLFVVEQGGKIKILPSGASTALATPFLDVSTLISGGGERGLLGLAFHPQYASNGAFFVYYTKAGSGSLVISRFLRSAGNPLAADPASEAVLLDIPHPNNSNHNGGHLAFGPDGYLYIGTGDGGGGGDPDGNGQKLSTRLGKMLRISVSAAAGYTVPPTNPFANSSCATACPEIWAYGLRNPWKFSFDRANGDMFIGDVGQGLWEEIDRVSAGTSTPLNFGWNVYEGNNCYGASSCAIASGLAPHTPPVIEYGHNSTGGFSVTGGYVYRGTRSPLLRGYYIYGDFASQRIWAAKPNASGSWTPELLLSSPSSISSFGEDERGELYVVGYATGKIYAIRGPLGSFSDLNGDGKTDLILDSYGSITGILMDGNNLVAYAGFMGVGSGWTPTHMADLNGDGKADILWRHTDGRVAAWLMDGLSATAGSLFMMAGSGWSISHVADLNGDGKADIIWKHTDGRVAAWLMDGISAIGGGNFMSAGSGWSITHVADFNGDGKADILWRNTNGAVAAWLMDGVSAVAGGNFMLAGSGWSVTHTADFNGDGKADILWRHADGRVAAWLMNGLGAVNGGLFMAAGSGWSATHTVDLDGDGKADILWRNTNGSNAAWLMNGLAAIGGATLTSPGSWVITNVGDFNGDGKTDLIWRDAQGQGAMWLMNGTTPLWAGAFGGASFGDIVPVP